MPETAAPDDPLAVRIEATREFNRFYTRRIGVLHEGLLHTRFTLTESRRSSKVEDYPATR